MIGPPGRAARPHLAQRLARGHPPALDAVAQYVDGGAESDFGFSQVQLLAVCTCDKGRITGTKVRKHGFTGLAFFTRIPGKGRGTSMDNMVRVTAGEFGREVGRYQDLALTQPVIITRNGRDRTVNHRLRRRDRQVGLGISSRAVGGVPARGAAGGSCRFNHEYKPEP